MDSLGKKYSKILIFLVRFSFATSVEILENDTHSRTGNFSAIESRILECFPLCQRFRNFGRNLNGKSVSVSSDRSIRDHLWRCSSYFGWNIPTEIRRSIFDNRFFALKGHFRISFSLFLKASLGAHPFI